MRGRPEEAISDLKVCVLPACSQIAWEQALVIGQERAAKPPHRTPLPTSFANSLTRQIEKPQSSTLVLVSKERLRPSVIIG